jgi:hypothetical protein
MRHIERHEMRRCGTAALHEPECASDSGLSGPQAGHSGPGMKKDLASLLPGGMTKKGNPDFSGFLHTSSPEPVIGYGAAKGLEKYYQAVLVFDEMPDTS